MIGFMLAKDMERTPGLVNTRTLTNMLIAHYFDDTQRPRICWYDVAKVLLKSLKQTEHLVYNGSLWYFKEGTQFADIEHIILEALDQNQDPTRD